MEDAQEYKKTGERKGTEEMIWRRKINKYYLYVVYLTTFLNISVYLPSDDRMISG